MRIWMMLVMVLSTSGIAANRPLDALDAPGGPAWLAKPWQAAWRLAPMADVLADLARATGLPIAQSEAAHLVTGDRRVVLVDGAPSTLGAAIALLERSQGVRFSSASGALRMTTPQEYMLERHEARWYDLAAYGLADLPRDQPARELGLEARRGETPQVSGQGSAAATFVIAGLPAQPGASDPAAIMDLLKIESGAEEAAREGSSFDWRGSGLLITTTPDVHARIVAILSGLHATATRRVAWRAVFGLLPAGEQFPTGVLDHATAAAVAQRLTDAQTLLATGIIGQTVHTAARQDHALLDRADAVNYHLDPAIDTLYLGRSLEIRALAGQALNLLSYRLAWVEDAGPAATALQRSPDHVLPDGLGDAKPGAAPGPGPVVRGERIPLELPVVWSWRPCADFFLAPGQALVLASEHPAGQAVIVLMEEQP
ncbi:MAG: hypothetical protein H0X38_11225 [Planctomycetes bacterium]|nr:hypothetical protein [Planctomycetota bacterium]